MELYSSTSGNVLSLLDSLNPNFPTNSPDFKDFNYADIEMFEFDSAVKQLSLRKSPSHQTSIKHFWEDIKSLFSLLFKNVLKLNI